MHVETCLQYEVAKQIRLQDWWQTFGKELLAWDIKCVATNYRNLLKVLRFYVVVKDVGYSESTEIFPLSFPVSSLLFSCVNPCRIHKAALRVQKLYRYS